MRLASSSLQSVFFSQACFYYRRLRGGGIFCLLRNSNGSIHYAIMNSPFAPFFAIILAVISIQFGAASAKQLFPQAGAIGITLLRLSFASAMLLLVWRPLRNRLSSTQLKAAMYYGVSLGLMNLTFYLAIERIPLGLAVALEFSGPLMLALLGSKKRIDFLWAILAALGIVLISPFNTISGVDLLGVGFALMAAMFWASYIICGKRVACIMPEGHAATFGMIFATLAVLPVALITRSHANLSLEILPQALLVALFSSAVPYSLEMFALKRLSKLGFGVLMSMEPAMAAIMGIIMLREYLLPIQIVAIVLIMVASLGTTFTQVAKTRLKPE